MTGYLLDTSALSAYLNEEHPHHTTATNVIGSLPSDSAKLVSAITLGELNFGLQLAELKGSRRLDAFRQRLEVIRQYTAIQVSRHTSDTYAELKARLAAQVQRKAKGKMPRWVEDWVDDNSAKKLQIDENDLWICAQAKERDLIVITGDVDIRQLTAVDPELRILLTCA